MGAAPRVLVDDPSSGRSTFTHWYRGLTPAQRATFNEQRRQKYRRNVGGLADKQRDRSRKHQRAMRREKGAPVRRLPLLVGGKRRWMMVLSSHDLGLAIGRDVSTLNRWWQQGVLPPPLIRTRAGRTFFTVAQRNLIIQSARDCGVRRKRLRCDRPLYWAWPTTPGFIKAFSRLVWLRWSAIPEGVGDAWQRIEGPDAPTA